MPECRSLSLIVSERVQWLSRLDLKPRANNKIMEKDKNI